MRFYKKRLLIAVVCLALSAALTWKLFELTDETKQTVILIQASRRIEKGSLITADMLRRVEVGAYGAEADAYKSDEGLIGKYAACDLFPGDCLTPEKFKTVSDFADSYVIKTREEGKSAVSIQLKGVSAGMSGKLKTGDVVSAFVFINEGGIGSGKGSVISYPELQYLEIAAVTNSRAEDINYDPEREIDYERVKSLGDTAIPATVIFIVDERQALRLVEAENTGAVHLVFRGRGEYARTLLAGQNAEAAAYEDDSEGGAALEESGEGGAVSAEGGSGDYAVSAEGGAGADAADSPETDAADSPETGVADSPEAGVADSSETDAIDMDAAEQPREDLFILD